jgi:ketosteroid isomerase-like protein
MSGELQRQRVLNFLDAFYGGDTAAALRCCDDDIESMVYLPVELFPHLGPRRGKAAISELMDVHEARYSSRRFEVKFLVVDEQRAAGIVDVAFTKRSDGRVLQMPSGLFLSLRRGLITELRSFFDTIDMIAQLTGRDLVSPLLREAGPALRPPKMPAEPATAKTLSKKYT